MFFSSKKKEQTSGITKKQAKALVKLSKKYNSMKAAK